jgi:thiosulfate/3-mercaptopyruvate sulfurtransferase
MAELLISIEELRRLAPEAARLVDVRWKLGDPSAGRRIFEAGHIPGAVYVDMDQDLAAPPGPGGRHPLPKAAQFEQSMGRAGIGNETWVIAYDDGGAGAPRLWWLLRHFGHDNVSILDGGFPAWLAAGGQSETGSGAQPAQTTFQARPRQDDFIDTDELQQAVEARRVHLVDARAPERWRGDVEPVDKVAGRIPGSVNAPSGDNLKDGHFRSAEELRLYYERLGVLDGKRLVGSFSGWIARGLPVARGSASD